MIASFSNTFVKTWQRSSARLYKRICRLRDTLHLRSTIDRTLVELELASLQLMAADLSRATRYAYQNRTEKAELEIGWTVSPTQSRK